MEDLVVHCQSAKVLSVKKLLGLMNSNIEWALPLPTTKVFSANFLAVPTLLKFSPAKVLCYTVATFDVVREHYFSCCGLLEQLQYMKTHVHVYILQIGKKYSHHTYPIHKLPR